MERLFELASRSVRTCRVESCCCVAPLRAGLLVAAYLNVVVALVLVVGTASGADLFWPLVARVQAQLLEDAASPAVCVLAPAADLAATALLLCGLHRNDPVLLRVYLYYGVAGIGVSLVVYSLLVALISALYLLVIVLSLIYQAYIVVLVRSLIVEIKLQSSGDMVGTYDTRLGTGDVERGRGSRRPATPAADDMLAVEHGLTRDEGRDRTDTVETATTLTSSTLTRDADIETPAASANTETVMVDTSNNTGAAVTPAATAPPAVHKVTVNTAIVDKKTSAAGGSGAKTSAAGGSGAKTSAAGGSGAKTSAAGGSGSKDVTATASKNEETVVVISVPAVPSVGTVKDESARPETDTKVAASDAAPAPHKKRRGIFSRKPKESGAKKDGDS